MTRIGHLPIILALLLLAILVGCGGAGTRQSDPTATSIPAPGTSPATTTQIRAINSAGLDPAQFSAQIERINAQLILVGSHWGTNTALYESSGPVDGNAPSLDLVATDSRNLGGYTLNGHGIVNLAKAGDLWPAYLSHVAINLSTHDLAGQAVEAYDYHLGDDGKPSESPPFNLADFSFPGPQQDGYGATGLDYLHKLAFP
jgi:hypothetical protein